MAETVSIRPREFPTDKCTQELHDTYGGGCYYCCSQCNYDQHRCHFCGDDLKHDGTLWSTGEENLCYKEQG